MARDGRGRAFPVKAWPSDRSECAPRQRSPLAIRNGSPSICTIRFIGLRSASGVGVAFEIGIETKDARWHSARKFDQEKLGLYRPAMP